MRVGIIDLGTNSVRFDVQEIRPGKGRASVIRLHREKLMVRLGQDVFTRGKLDPEAVRRTLQAFESFHRTAKELQVNKISAFGTSALREASDSGKLLSEIRRRSGIEVRVISGEEEARLIAKGILKNEQAPKGMFALVDIGGGSTEISICRGKEILVAHSFGLGTARLQQVFLKTSPPRPAGKKERHPIDQLRRYVKSVILPTLIAEEWPHAERIVGSSGTILAVEKAIHNNRETKKKSDLQKSFDRKDLKKFVDSIKGMSTSQLLNVPGIEPRRVDMILAGAVLLDEVMECLKIKKITTTDYSLRDGILDETVETLRKHQTSPLAFHLGDLYAKAKRLGAQESHLKQVQSLVEALFDRLARVHKLKKSWRTYLSAAAILHDAGEAVSPTNHAIHSYYIVMNAGFPLMEDWECEFIAQLCLWHTGGKIQLKEIPFRNDKKKMQAFLKLLALFRIADALDRNHKALVSLKSIKISSKEVTLGILSKAAADLEILRIEQKKDLFEKTFKRRLAVKRV
jgi:exopolyphosphatase/guanosine-5'-triphosphate,3'-diphosphate pyrophosphatase